MILKRKKKHLAHDGPVFFLYSSLIETRTMLFGEAWWQADYSLSPASDVAGCMHDSFAHLVSSTFDTPWALALYVTLLPVILL